MGSNRLEPLVAQQRQCVTRASPLCLSPTPQVLALQETLQRLEKADDVLLRLTEDKASLQLQLHESQVAATRAQSEAEERGRHAAEVDGTCQDLRRQLDAAMAQHDVAHAAVEGAADQMQQLTDSHEALERELAAAGAQLEAAQGELAQRAQQAPQLEQRVTALEAELRQGLQQRDAALAQLQELHRGLGAAQQEAAAQHQLAAEGRERLAAAATEHEGLATQLAGLQAENDNLKDNLKVPWLCCSCQLCCGFLIADLHSASSSVGEPVPGVATCILCWPRPLPPDFVCLSRRTPTACLLQALEAECEAVRRLGANVDQTNQTLVDNMCDMSGKEQLHPYNTAGGLYSGDPAGHALPYLHSTQRRCQVHGRVRRMLVMRPERSIVSRAGLVDAVQALQQRNRLLQQDLDTLKGKYTGRQAVPCCTSRL